MSFLIPRIRILLQAGVVAVAVASGIWASHQQVQQPQTSDVVADGGQWGNKGGRIVCG